MRHLYSAVFVFLAFCVSAFTQESGTIICDPGSTLPVPAWTLPGGANVVEQLSCGQMVSIMGLERGYFRIQLRFHALKTMDSRHRIAGLRCPSHPTWPKDAEEAEMLSWPASVVSPEARPARLNIISS